MIKRYRPRSRQKAKSTGHKDPLMAVLEEGMQQALGTKVRINYKKKRGEIIIEFYSREDAQRLAAIMKKGAGA